MSKILLAITSLLSRLLPSVIKQSLYRMKPVAAFIRGWLNLAAPQGIVTVAVAAGELSTAKLRLNMHTEKDYWLGTYEPELQAAIKQLIQHGNVVFDVGANIGYISLLLARAVGTTGKVFAFEALPDNLKRLRENTALNPEGSRVSVVPNAVVDKSGMIKFLVGPSPGTGKTLGSAGREMVYKDSISVEGISLDDFVYNKGKPYPQVVKMDIEGGEILALRGMQRVLNEAHPTMLLELHGEDCVKAAWETLIEAGYRISRMVPGFPVVQSRTELDWKAYLVAQWRS